MARIEDTDYPSVVVDSDVTASSPPDAGLPICEELPITEKNQLNSTFAETHVSIDMVNELASDSDDSEETPSLEYLLTSLWFGATFSVLLVAFTAILSIWHVFRPKLPKDSQTVLRMQGEIPTRKMEGEEYHHFGLATGLLPSRKSLTLPVNTVWMQFNVDGLPLFKSSRLQLWSILATVNVDHTGSPFPVGLFCGNSKPKRLSFWGYSLMT